MQRHLKSVLGVLVLLFGIAFDSQPASAEDKPPRPIQEGYLGAQLGVAESLPGVVIVALLPGSPGALAGLQVGDRLTSLNGETAEDPSSVARDMRNLGAGEVVAVNYEREGKRRSAQVHLGINPWQKATEPDVREGLYVVDVRADLAYRAGPDADARQQLDLYLPRSETPVPLLVWIHGGGWSMGGREHERALALRFAERGVAVAAMSYRLSAAHWADPTLPDTGVTHPAHINDVADAFRWLHKSAKRFGLDPARLYVGGHSAGGHLAALLASDPRYLENRGLDLEVIAGALPIGGAYDIPDYHAALMDSDPELGKAHIEAVFGTDPGGWREASPTQYLANSSVPMLVIVEDQAAFQRYGERLRLAAREQGRENITFVDAVGRTHANVVLLMSGRHEDDIRARMLAFMRSG